MRREARLKSEYAKLYPSVTPGVWQAAAAVADLVRTQRELTNGEDSMSVGRVLSDAHFEFRGGTPRALAAGLLKGVTVDSVEA